MPERDPRDVEHIAELERELAEARREIADLKKVVKEFFGNFGLEVTHGAAGGRAAGLGKVRHLLWASTYEGAVDEVPSREGQDRQERRNDMSKPSSPFVGREDSTTSGDPSTMWTTVRRTGPQWSPIGTNLLVSWDPRYGPPVASQPRR